jgi:biotin transport system substrate-specific component
MKKTDIRKIIMCAFFSAMIIVGAYIRIPIPPVPVTLQSFFVLLSGMVLGSKQGVLSVLVYIGLGLVGIPVFAGGTGGIGSVMMPTFGYVLGFVPAAYLSAKLSGDTYAGYLMAALVSMGTIYICGAGYYLILQELVLGGEINLFDFILSFFAISIPKDIVACLAVSAVAKRLSVIR